MYPVSKEYAQSMKSSLRERSYIQILMDTGDQETKVSSATGSFESYSSISIPHLTEPQNPVKAYATLEEDFLPVDGSMYFLPRNQAEADEVTGLTQSGMFSNPVTWTISLDKTTSFMGFTISFGELPPVDFILSIGSKNYSFSNNEQDVIFIDEFFGEVSSISVTANRMPNNNCRLRIHYVVLGRVFNFNNHWVKDSSLDHYVSPINETLPQIDFEATLINHDDVFNIDNPDGYIPYLKFGQRMSLSYIYDLPNGVKETIPACTLYLEDWDNNDYTATLRFVDGLRGADKPYSNDSTFNHVLTYASLAEDVFSQLGKFEYELHPSMFGYSLLNTLENVNCKEVLQIIANGSNCVLDIDRNGKIVFRRYDDQSEDFVMTYRDMTDNPNAYKENIYDVISVPRTAYQINDSYTTIAIWGAGAAFPTRMTKYFSGDWVDVRLVADPTSAVTDVTYYKDRVEYTLNSRSATFTLSGKGRIPYMVDNKIVLRDGDKVLEWVNPLWSSDYPGASTDMLLKLAYYYGSDSTRYDYPIRGNPELNPGDLIAQENKYVTNMKVRITRIRTNFNGSLSGYIEAYREEVASDGN